MNKVILIGRLTADPEVRTFETADGDRLLCKFSIAVPRRRSKDDTTDFFDCTLWGNGGKIIEQYFHKGNKILVEGSVQIEKKTTDSGEVRRYTNIMVSDFEFVESKNSGSATSNSDDDLPI